MIIENHEKGTEKNALRGVGRAIILIIIFS